MIRAGLAVVATVVLLTGIAGAQQPPAAAPPPPPDFSKVEIKTTDLGDGVYMLEGQGGNITVAVGRTASSWWTASSRRCMTRSRPRSP